MEDAEPDSRGRIVNVGDRRDGERYDKELQTPAQVAPGQCAARPRQDDKKPGKEMLGHQPGDSGQVCRKPQTSFDTNVLAQVVEKVVADHEDDGQAAQEIDLPDALGYVLLTHRARILRSTPRRQGPE